MFKIERDEFRGVFKQNASAKVAVILLMLVQIGFWWGFSKDVKPNLGKLPDLPGKMEVEALSFGDKQLYFRAMALNVQMAGDTFGRVTPLKDYDYEKLKEWLFLFDQLDWKSNYVPSAAAYYYARTQNPPDVVHIVDYLEQHALRDPEAKWWWLSQAIYLANSVLGDKERAIKFAQELRKVEKDIPLWARQMEIFLREDLGQLGKSEEMMCDILTNLDLSAVQEFEINFMIHFFEERLKTVQEQSIESVVRRCAELGFLGQ